MIVSVIPCLNVQIDIVMDVFKGVEVTFLVQQYLNYKGSLQKYKV